MDLFELINKTRNKQEAEKLLELILTEKEQRSINERIKILLELKQGKTQRKK